MSNGFGAERVGAPVALLDQGVGLVDEQHSPDGAVDGAAGLHRGLALVLGDEILARRFDELGLGDHAEAGQDAGHHAGDRRLTRAGRAGEDHVLGRLGDLHAARRADLGHLRRRAVRLDLLLDPGQADLAVEFGLRIGEQFLAA